MCVSKINKVEQINRGRKVIQNSNEKQTNIAYQISKDSFKSQEGILKWKIFTSERKQDLLPQICCGKISKEKWQSTAKSNKK